MEGFVFITIIVLLTFGLLANKEKEKEQNQKLADKKLFESAFEEEQEEDIVFAKQNPLEQFDADLKKILIDYKTNINKELDSMKNKDLEQQYREEYKKVEKDIEDIKNFAQKNNLIEKLLILESNKLFFDNEIYSLVSKESSTSLPDGEDYTTVNYKLNVNEEVVFEFTRVKTYDRWGYSYGKPDIKKIIIDEWVIRLLKTYEQYEFEQGSKEEQRLQTEFKEQARLNKLKQLYQVRT